MKRFLLPSLTFLFISLQLLAQDGSNDATFNSSDIGLGYGDGLSGIGYALAIQPDNKIIVGGSFPFANSSNRKNLARYNATGTLDTTFMQTGSGFNGTVTALALQTDGKIIVGGGFITYNGDTVNRIARLYPDGSLDTTFIHGTGFNNVVYSLLIQPDGKIIAGGDFTSYDSSARTRMARLLVDGSLDTTFTIGTGFNSAVRALALQADNKIMVGGDFLYFNSVLTRAMTRLNTDGSQDTAFYSNPGLTGTLPQAKTLVIQPDGKIIVGGFFDAYNNTPRSRIARINIDGSIDASFGSTSDYVAGPIYSVVLQPGGEVIAGGGFTTFNGQPKKYFVRLTSAGAYDNSWTGNGMFDGQVNAMAQLTNGTIMVTGSYNKYNGQYRGWLAKINGDGSLNAFNEGTGFSSFNLILNPPNSTGGSFVSSIAVTAGDKMYAAGSFRAFNGQWHNCIARLNSDGSNDNAFIPVSGVDTFLFSFLNSVAVQADGKVIVAGDFRNQSSFMKYGIARLNSSGSLDTAFIAGLGTGFWPEPSCVAIQTDGKIIVGGTFTQFNGNTCNHIARLNTNGTLDNTFITGTGFNYDVRYVAIQPDGKIIVSGNFNTYNGSGCGLTARLNTNGSLDNTFSTNASGSFYSMTLQPDGKIIGSGTFFNPPKGITRLNADGSQDTTFNVGTGFTAGIAKSVLLQPDGKVLVGGGLFSTFNGTPVRLILRLNSDGSLDTTFNVGSGPNADVRALALQSNNKVIVGGYFTSEDGYGRNRMARLNNLIVGVEEAEHSGSFFSVFPNPATNELVIRSSEFGDESELIIFNALDEKVFSKVSNLKSQFSVDISHLSTGIYFLQLKSDSQKRTEKFLISR